MKDQLDDEAITHLNIAWQSPTTTELLDSEGRPLVLRSLWIVVEAARLMPQETRITELAAVAMERARPFIDKARASVEQTPGDASAYLGLLYATLALPEGDKLRFRLPWRLDVQTRRPGIAPGRAAVGQRSY